MSAFFDFLNNYIADYPFPLAPHDRYIELEGSENAFNLAALHELFQEHPEEGDVKTIMLTVQAIPSGWTAMVSIGSVLCFEDEEGCLLDNAGLLRDQQGAVYHRLQTLMNKAHQSDVSLVSRPFPPMKAVHPFQEQWVWKEACKTAWSKHKLETALPEATLSSKSSLRL